MRGFAAAAAVCLLAAGGYTIVQLTSPSRPGHTLSPGAGAAIHHGLRNGPGAYHLSPSPRQGSSILRPSPPTFEVISSGTDYRSTTLGTQVERELSEIGRIGANTPSGGTVRHKPSAQQEACVQNVVPGVVPTLVDAASYQGQPATVIALAPGAGQLGQAWVVGPVCSGDRGDILAHVRLSSAGG